MLFRQLIILILFLLWVFACLWLSSHPTLLCLIGTFPLLIFLKSRLNFFAAFVFSIVISFGFYLLFLELSPEMQITLASIIPRLITVLGMSLASYWLLKSLKAEEAAITKVARHIRQDDMPKEVVQYTRNLTIFWGILLASLAFINSLLFFVELFTGRHYTVQFLNALIVACVFILELLVRRWHLGKQTSLKRFFKHLLTREFWQQNR